MKKSHPNGWRQLTLSDCITLRSGGTPSKSNPDYWNGDIPWVTCKDMKTNRLYDSEDHVTNLGAEEGTRFAPKGAILIVVRGMILAKEFPVAVAQRPVTFNQDLKAVECYECVSPSFMYYWLAGNAYQIKGIADEAAHGTKRLQTDRLLNLPISLPPVSTQNKITRILSAYDDLIENNTRRIAILEEIAQSIYREWFVNFRFPGHEKVKLVDSPIGKIPEGWRVVKVEELGNHSTEGVTPAKYPNEDFAHFSIPNYDNGKLPEREKGVTIQSNKFIVKSGCVMLSKLNPRIPRIWLPESSVDCRSVASTEFLIVLPQAPATREFLYYQFQSDGFSGRFLGCSSGTSTSHQRVKPTDFLKLTAILPSSPLIAAFTSHVGPLCRLIHNLRIHKRKLQNTRDLLLPKLISGQLDVEDLEIDIGEMLQEAAG